jgi:hypothetical protein
MLRNRANERQARSQSDKPAFSADAVSVVRLERRDGEREIAEHIAYLVFGRTAL